MLSISGVFSVTFSVVFAYVADVTTEEDRSQAYGLVCITRKPDFVECKQQGADQPVHLLFTLWKLQ